MRQSGLEDQDQARGYIAEPAGRRKPEVARPGLSYLKLARPSLQFSCRETGPPTAPRAYASEAKRPDGRARRLREQEYEGLSLLCDSPAPSQAGPPVMLAAARAGG
jgi:hypothetical protein